MMMKVEIEKEISYEGMGEAKKGGEVRYGRNRWN